MTAAADHDPDPPGEIGDVPALVMGWLAQRGNSHRAEQFADDANPFARPYPEQGWVDRDLPDRSSALSAARVDGSDVHFVGHDGHRNQFPTPPCCEES